MKNSTKRYLFSSQFYKLAIGSLLILATLISIILEKLLVYFNGGNPYSFLLFNLALAWIPMIAAALAYWTHRNRIAFWIFMPICTLIWLIFFPNAPYLLTDFQHLAYSGSETPLWFDVITLIWFAWTGLLLGVFSLSLMQEVVTDVFNRFTGWGFAIGVTILSSLGVYLGRFLRWNSWDLLYDPIPIARDLYSIVRHPMSNLPTYVFTILFTLLFLFIYLTFHLFSGATRREA